MKRRSGVVDSMKEAVLEVKSDVDPIRPSRLFLKILIVIAVAEFIVMVILWKLNLTEGPFEFLVDSLLLSVLSAPFLYLWVVRAVSGKLKRAAEIEQTALKKELAEKALTEKLAMKQHTENIVNNVPSSIMLVSKEMRVISANPSFSGMFNNEDVVGKPIGELLSLHPLGEAVSEVFSSGKSCHDMNFDMETPSGTKNLEAQVIEIRSSEADSERQALVVIDDVTERKAAEKTIYRMAYYDNLTGLANRRLLIDRLNHALGNARRQGLYAAVMFIDLDRFKFINDTMGHDIGDELLKKVAGRLTSCVRPSDTVARNDEELADTVARLGGDEFILLFTDISRTEDLTRISKRVLSTLDRPIRLRGHEIFVTASMGISVYPYDGKDAQELLKKADLAMYRAKEEGRNNCQFYYASLENVSKSWLKLENKLRKAIKNEEFVLHYQPQIDIRTGEITGVEALVRWQDPETELIPPGRFISVAEESGLIVPISEWVLRTACAMGRARQERGANPARMSVNISIRQFKEKGFVDTVKRALEETGFPAENLDLELTESIIMKDTEAAIEILRTLKDLGLGLVIDDFGTGFSSLSYLKSMPIDTIKVDRSFIRDITVDPNDAAITIAIVRMAHSLGIEVIAEGVETMGQLKFLKKIECDKFQGFLVLKPVPMNEFEEFLKTWKGLYGARVPSESGA